MASRRRRLAITILAPAAAFAVACNALFDISKGVYLEGAAGADGGAVDGGGDAPGPSGDGGTFGDGGLPDGEPVLVASNVAGDGGSVSFLAVSDELAIAAGSLRLTRVALSGAPAPTTFFVTSGVTVIRAVALTPAEVYFIDKDPSGTRVHRCPVSGCASVTMPGAPVYATGDGNLTGLVAVGPEVYWSEGNGPDGGGGVFHAGGGVFAGGENVGELAASADTVILQQLTPGGGILEALPQGAHRTVLQLRGTAFRLAADGDRIVWAIDLTSAGGGQAIDTVLFDGGGQSRYATFVSGTRVTRIALADGVLYFMTETGVLRACALPSTDCANAPRVTLTDNAIVDFGLNSTDVVWLQADGSLYRRPRK